MIVDQTWKNDERSLIQASFHRLSFALEFITSRRLSLSSLIFFFFLSSSLFFFFFFLPLSILPPPTFPLPIELFGTVLTHTTGTELLVTHPFLPSLSSSFLLLPFFTKLADSIVFLLCVHCILSDCAFSHSLPHSCFFSLFFFLFLFRLSEWKFLLKRFRSWSEIPSINSMLKPLG